MLTPEDIEFMKKTRKEIVSHREHPVTLFYALDGEADPITGEPIGGGQGEIYTNAVVTEIASQSQVDRYLSNGIEVEKGDIWFSVNIDSVIAEYPHLNIVNYEGRNYTILARDKKGIGERNRVEMVGRLET